jgi:hypothetical protein
MTDADAANCIAARVWKAGNWSRRHEVAQATLARKIRKEMANASRELISELEGEVIAEDVLGSLLEEPSLQSIGLKVKVVADLRRPPLLTRLEKHTRNLPALMRFAQAFPDVADPKQPVTLIARLYDEVVAKLKELTGTTCGK